MKYSIDYNKKLHTDFLDKVDEIQIKYSKTDTTLPDFLEKYKDKTIVLRNCHPEDIERIELLSNTYHNIKVSLLFDQMEDIDFIHQLQEKKIPFYCSYAVDCWSDMADLMSLHPCEIIITRDLGFQIKDISAVLHKNKIKLKVCPNVAQGGLFTKPDINSFFIRPNDIKIYEPYIDILELTDMEDKGNVETYFNIYKEMQEWFGDLKEIIFGLDESLDNRTLISSFGASRLNCGKRCVKGKRCQVCKNAQKLSQTLKEQNLIVRREKE